MIAAVGCCVAPRRRHQMQPCAYGAYGTSVAARVGCRYRQCICRVACFRRCRYRLLLGHGSRFRRCDAATVDIQFSCRRSRRGPSGLGRLAGGTGAGGNARPTLPCTRRHPSYGSNHPDPNLHRASLIGQHHVVCFPPRLVAVVQIRRRISRRSMQKGSLTNCVCPHTSPRCGYELAEPV